MSYTITKSIEAGITKLVRGCVEEAIEILSVQYGFEVEEARELVDCKKEERAKVTKKAKVAKKPTIPLPYCYKVFEGQCFGIRINHGLYTQCNQQPMEGCDYCKTCKKQTETNTETQKPNAGDIRDRSLGNWEPTNKLVKYGNVMEKLGISREEAEKVAAENGVVIPEHEFEVVKGRRGRPKKDTTSTSSSDDDEAPKKRGRGRPKKTKTVMSTSSGDDLIAQLVAAAAESTTSDSEGDAVSPTETAKAEKAAAKEAEKAAKEAAKAEKAAAKEAAKAAKEAAKAAKEAEKAAKEAEKAAKEDVVEQTDEVQTTPEVTPQTMEQAVSRPTIQPLNMTEYEELAEEEMSEEESEAESEAESDGELEVVPKTVDGKEYLMDERTGELYDATTHELIPFKFGTPVNRN